MLPFVKHHALYFLFEFLFISVMISPSVGSFDTVDIYICENEDATLTWQITSALDVESKVLYKGETLVASWPKGYQLIIYTPYENRLVQIGESAIKIKNVTRSDSGAYKFILSHKSMTNRSEVLIDLHVIVPPTDDCIAIIAHEEDTLRAKLPESGCGIPGLIPYWKYVNQSHVSSNISILQPESRHQPRTYTACPVGKALKCFTGSPDRLCTNFTLDESWPKDEHKSWSLTAIIIPASIVPFVILAIVIILVLFLRRKRNQPKSARESHAVVYNPNEGTPLTENETSATALTEKKMTDLLTSVQEKIAAATDMTVKIQAKDTGNVLTKMQEISLMQQKQGSNESKEDKEAKGERLRGKYPQFRTVKSRLDSFVNWPSDCHLQPDELAKAGLFYQGQRDCVVCFSCGGKLSQWEPTDTAWAEHEQKYPKCEYVKSHKKNDSSLPCIDETEDHEDIQSRKDPSEKEQCNSYEMGEQMKRESKNIQLLCKTCQVEKACMIFIPCTHFAACYACAYKLLKCSECQQEIRNRVKAYCS